MTRFTLLSVKAAVERDSSLNDAMIGLLAYCIKFKLSERLDATVDLWIKDREKQNAEINGLSLFGIMESEKCDYPTALVLLSICAEDPLASGSLFFEPFDHIEE